MLTCASISPPVCCAGYVYFGLHTVGPAASIVLTQGWHSDVCALFWGASYDVETVIILQRNRATVLVRRVFGLVYIHDLANTSWYG